MYIYSNMGYGGDFLQLYRAELIDKLNIPVGDSVKLESLRQSIFPPYEMLIPFIEVPNGLVVKDQLPLDEDGLHGSVYMLKAAKSCEGDIVVGFRDIRTGEVTHRKEIHVTTR